MNFAEWGTTKFVDEPRFWLAVRIRTSDANEVDHSLWLASAGIDGNRVASELADPRALGTRAIQRRRDGFRIRMDGPAAGAALSPNPAFRRQQPRVVVGAKVFEKLFSVPIQTSSDGSA